MNSDPKVKEQKGFIDSSGEEIKERDFIINELRDKLLVLEKQLKNKDESLNSVEDRFRKAFHSNPAAMIITKLQTGQIIDCNQSFEILSGYLYDDLLGKSTRELGIYHDPKFRDKLIDEVEKSGKVRNKEMNLVSSSGEVKLCQFYSEKIEIDGENCLLSIINDITEQRRAEEARNAAEAELRLNQQVLKQQNEEYQALNEELNESNSRIKEVNDDLVKILEKIEKSEAEKSELLNRLNKAQEVTRVGSWDWNIETGEMWWSDELYRIAEMSPDNYKPQSDSITKFIHPEDVEAFRNAIDNAIRTGIPLDHELRIVTSKGNPTDCKATGEVYYNSEGKPVRLAGTFGDISRQKKVLNDLIQAKQKAEESDRLKSAFLANMSHEIRTPMNAIIGFTQFLLKPELSNDKKIQYVSIISEQAYALLRIVEDILDVSKIEVGQLKIISTDVDLSNLMNETFDYYYQRIKVLEGKSQLSISMHLDERLNGLNICTDEQRLKQVLKNLLDNAVKFTEKGIIEIGCDIKDKNLVFFVKDSGIGISSEKLDIIFDRFRQAEDSSTSKKYGGTGLGLSIVKGLVELMKGNMWVESELNKGTTFYFSLPFQGISDVAQKPEPFPIELDTKVKNYTVLVVEDDKANREFLKELFIDSNFDLLVAENGAETIDIVRRKPHISVILMDIRLPDINGLELTRIVRRDYPQIKVIAQTAYASPADIQECMKAGCHDFISKPINIQKLFTALNKYLN